MSRELKVEFARIIKTPTQFPQDTGILEVTVTNSGNETVVGTSLNLYASTDDVLDAGVLNTNDDLVPGSSSINALQGTDEFLGSISEIVLEAGESKKITIDFKSNDFQTPSVVSAGGYNLIAKVDPFNTVTEANEVDNEAVKYISTLKTDQVLDWNSVFLNISQTEGKNDLADGVKLTDTEVPGIAPPIQARDAAILHLAIYDAVNGVKGNNHEPYLPDLNPPAPATASASAATIGAAYTVLSELYPEYQDLLDKQLDRSIQELKGPVPFFVEGYKFGTEVAHKLLDLRADDGADQYYSYRRPNRNRSILGIRSR
jgi:hypothetical protein